MTTVAGSRPATLAEQVPRRSCGVVLSRAGTALLTLSLLAITWNGVVIFGLHPADWLLLAAAPFVVAAAVAAGTRPYLPRAMWIAGGIIGLAGALSILFPVPEAYLLTRYYDATVGAAFSVPGTAGNLYALAKFELALLLLPLVMGLAVARQTTAERFASAFALSALASALVAITDAVGATHIGTGLLHIVDTSGRHSGLAAQENHLAVSVALATPIVLRWLIRPHVGIKLAGLTGVAVIFAGIVVSGSRGGAAGCVLAAVLSVLIVRSLRGARWPLALAGLLSAAVVIFYSPASEFFGTQLRLLGNLGSASDAGRSLLLQEGWADFGQSPAFGIGFYFLTAAHDAFLQLLAAGGIIALLGYLLYWGNALGMGIGMLARGSALGSALLVSVVVFLMLNFVENQIGDLYLYVAPALLVALRRPARMHGGSS